MSHQGRSLLLTKLTQDVVACVGTIEQMSDVLVGTERELANTMTAARRREFSAGRNAARAALRDIHIADSAIPIGSQGEPVWPPGATGSISHSARHVCAIAALGTRHQSLGVDLDDSRPLGDAAAVDLMTNEEAQLVSEMGWASDRAAAQNVVFSAKEAIFKCQFPLTGCADLDFPDVRLAKGRRSGSIVVTTRRPDSELMSAVARISVFWTQIQGVTLTWAWVGPPQRG